MEDNPSILRTKSYDFALRIVSRLSLRPILSISCRSRTKNPLKPNNWLNLVRDSDYISEKQAGALIKDCCELQKILTASIKTAKKNKD